MDIEIGAVMMRIEVDYNTVTGDPAERFVIPARCRSGPDGGLTAGQRVIAFEQGDYEVEAVLEYDAPRDAWFGRPDWGTFRELSAAPEAALASAHQHPAR